MENTKTITLTQFFEQAYIALDSGQDFEDFIEDNKQILDLYKETTQLREDNERLREMLSKARYMYMVNVDEDGPKASVLSILKFWKEAEQLLNSTSLDHP